MLCADPCCKLIVRTVMNLQMKTADFSFTRSSLQKNVTRDFHIRACIFVFKTQRSIYDLIMQGCLTRPKANYKCGMSPITLSVVSSPDLMQWKESIKQIKLVLCTRAIHITSTFGKKWEERMTNRERERQAEGWCGEGREREGKSKSQRILKNTRSSRGLEICKYYKNEFFWEYYIITIII